MIIQRPRRLRQSPLIRELVAETRLTPERFVYPYFIVPGTGVKTPLKALPGIHHFSIDELTKHVGEGLGKYGLNKFLLFGSGEVKTEDGRSAYHEDTVVVKALKALRREFHDDIFLITDVCACAYTTHGHCGVIKEGQVDNDASMALMGKIALAHAGAGADMVAPSDMMDGRVGHIRKVLDENNFLNTAIMSYAVKFASAYYGPFREAADSSPAYGDRKGYQMDFRNAKESFREAFLDENEGADILMVKPALAYLDIISQLSQRTSLPIACYNVSGEYAMIKAAAASGVIDEAQLVRENMIAMARAGAQVIVSYHIREMMEKNWL